jgi:hypothetical protein
LPAALLLGVAQVHAGLVLHYTFDETSGTTAADSSGSGRSGTLTNMSGTEWTTGKVGGALSFDGTNDYVSANGYRGITGTSARTIAFWFNTSTGDNTFLHYGGGAGPQFRMGLNSAGSAVVNSGNSAVHPISGGFADGTWHHFAVTLPTGAVGTDVKLYMNGAPSTGSGATAINTSTSNDVRLGWNAFGVTGYFNGQLDDVRFYDYELSAGEVSVLAGTNSTAPEPASVFASLGLLSAAGCGLREWRRRKKKA